MVTRYDPDAGMMFFCLSTDTKPTTTVENGVTVDIFNGSMCVEIDTGDVYLFDAAGAEWHKQ